MNTAREIHIVRPCIEDPKLFIAESNFGRSLDMELVCTILVELAIPEMRCSTRLGVARFRLDNWQIMIYREGRVDVRRVSNLDDASRAIDQTEKILQKAFID